MRREDRDKPAPTPAERMLEAIRRFAVVVAECNMGTRVDVRIPQPAWESLCKALGPRTAVCLADTRADSWIIVRHGGVEVRISQDIPRSRVNGPMVGRSGWVSGKTAHAINLAERPTDLDSYHIEIGEIAGSQAYGNNIVDAALSSKPEEP